jgi:hypothetical protein
MEKKTFIVSSLFWNFKGEHIDATDTESDCLPHLQNPRNFIRSNEVNTGNTYGIIQFPSKPNY